MNETLNPLQLLVAKHYVLGCFDSVKTTNDVRAMGDTLFTFCVLEAGDMSGPYDLRGALMRAIDELQALADDLEEV